MRSIIRFSKRLTLSLLAILLLAGSAQASVIIVGGIAIGIGSAITAANSTPFTVAECGTLTRARVRLDEDEDRWPKHNVYKYDFEGACPQLGGPITASAAFSNGERTAHVKIEIPSLNGKIQVTATCAADPFRYGTACHSHQTAITDSAFASQVSLPSATWLPFTGAVPEDIEHEVISGSPPPPPPPVGAFWAHVSEPASNVSRDQSQFTLALDPHISKYPPAHVKQEWQWRHQASGQWLALFESPAPESWAHFPKAMSTDLFSAGVGSYRVRIHGQDPDGKWYPPTDWHPIVFGDRIAGFATGGGPLRIQRPGQMVRADEAPGRVLEVKVNTLAILEPLPGQKFAANAIGALKVTLDAPIDIAAPGMGGSNGVIHMQWSHKAPGGSFAPLPWATSIACRGAIVAGPLGATVRCSAPEGEDRIVLTVDENLPAGDYEIRVKPAKQTVWSPPRRFAVIGTTMPAMSRAVAPSGGLTDGSAITIEARAGNPAELVVAGLRFAGTPTAGRGFDVVVTAKNAGESAGAPTAPLVVRVGGQTCQPRLALGSLRPRAVRSLTYHCPAPNGAREIVARFGDGVERKLALRVLATPGRVIRPQAATPAASVRTQSAPQPKATRRAPAAKAPLSTKSAPLAPR